MPETTPTAQKNNDTWAAMAQSIQAMKPLYQGLSMDSIFAAWSAAGGMNYMLGWPPVQNRRVKNINTAVGEYSKDQIADMVQKPADNERALRAVSASLDASAMTYNVLLQTRQDIMTYDWYVYPTEDVEDVGYRVMKREFILANKIANTMNLKAKGHEITGLCAKYGKVFYTPRVSVDKSHNKVNYAFLQQLPTDWCTIVGYNNGPGKYTVAFNMMYFCQPGTSPLQFGDLFLPYLPAFSDVVAESKGKYVYTSSNGYEINTTKFKRNDVGSTVGNPEWAQIGNVWYYWVTLPADRVMVFEDNDRTPDVVPSTTGMMVSMVQVPAYESAQLEIVLNPLTSIMTGELETYNTTNVPNADPIAVSPSLREYFESLWYQMLNRNNTSGIGLYMAPAKNLKLQTITDTVSSTNIAEHAYSDQIQKAGMSALIPTSSDPKVGVAELSAKIHARHAMPIYWAIERMMNAIYDKVGFKSVMRFRMFGDIFSRERDIEDSRKGMTLGLMVDTLRYDALMGHTLMDDIAIADMVTESGIMDKRLPLVSTYSARQRDGTLPPQAKQELDHGGRPAEPGSQSGQKNRDLLPGGGGGGSEPTGRRVDHWDDFDE